MLRFSCPQCDKALRATEDKAGSRVKCPECGNKLVVPGAIEEPEPDDDEPVVRRDDFDDDEPVVRRKKKKKSANAARAKSFAMASLGSPLLSWVLSIIGGLAGHPGGALVNLFMTCFQFLLIMGGIVFGILALLAGRKANGGLAVTLPAVAGIVLSTGTILLVVIMIVAAMAH